jgi:rhodanese-related sulfurtransferase
MKQLSPQELRQWQAEGRPFQLLDVREPDEHAARNIGGVLTPLSNLSSALGHIPADQPVVVYCKRGIRSQIAIQRLRAHFPEADFYNLQGGILAM